MDKFVVMINYGLYEGWKLYEITNSFDEAVKYRELALSMGNSEVVIFSPVKTKVLEVG